MKRKTFNRYVEYLCKELDITISDLFKKERSEKLSRARFLLYSICYTRRFTILEIKEQMSNNGYETSRQAIEYGLDKISSLYLEDKNIRRFWLDSIEYLKKTEDEL